MKNLIIASALAISSLLAVAAPSEAQTMSVTTTERMAPPRHHVRDMHPARGNHCMVKKTRVRSHGHWIVKTTRVCR